MVRDLRLRHAEAVDELADRELTARAQLVEDAQPRGVAESTELLGDQIALSRRLREPERRLHDCHIREFTYQNLSWLMNLSSERAI